MIIKDKLNKFVNKAKGLFNPGKTILTPSYQDPYMLQLEI